MKIYPNKASYRQTPQQQRTQLHHVPRHFSVALLVARVDPSASATVLHNSVDLSVPVGIDRNVAEIEE